MTQQGERHGHEDDWWRELYDEEKPDTGPAAAPDSLDDRFDSASRTVGSPPGPATPRPATPPPSTPRSSAPPSLQDDDLPQRAAEEGEWWQGSVSLPDEEPPRGPAPEEWPEPTWPPTAGAPARARAEKPGSAPPPGGAAGPDEPPPAGAGRPRPAVEAEYVGPRPPTYEGEPSALPAADPEDIGDLVPDTALDGARYGPLVLRAVSLRGDSARYRGEPRRDALLTARFGEGDRALLLVAVACGVRATEGAHRAAAELCQGIAAAVGRSQARLAEDIRAGRRGALKSGLHRLTDRSYGRLRARAAEIGLAPAQYTATLRCLLLPADPECRTRVFFGVGDGGLFRLRDGAWQDIEPALPEAPRTGAPVVGYGSTVTDRLTVDLAVPAQPSPSTPAASSTPSSPGGEPHAGDVQPPAEPFRFRASVARPGDTLVLCSSGLADPLRGESALGGLLAQRWAGKAPPGLATFLADVQLRVKGYADDRTAAAVWET
ncbi:protein phosphatase 2C domain-containing protein [Streptomyces sp. NPDC004647]|uniref:protein phosphatase 2C domain-containing protein n=1 Tax=Streptomyces sp. NPDC004647 TaxID=3154671 RepID=UPI0033A9014E